MAVIGHGVGGRNEANRRPGAAAARTARAARRHWDVIGDLDAGAALRERVIHTSVIIIINAACRIHRKKRKVRERVERQRWKISPHAEKRALRRHGGNFHEVGGIRVALGLASGGCGKKAYCPYNKTQGQRVWGGFHLANRHEKRAGRQAAWGCGDWEPFL